MNGAVILQENLKKNTFLTSSLTIAVFIEVNFVDKDINQSFTILNIVYVAVFEFLHERLDDRHSKCWVYTKLYGYLLFKLFTFRLHLF